jgi:hypothetical protein
MLVGRDGGGSLAMAMGGHRRCGVSESREHLMLLTAHPQQRQPGLFSHPEQSHTHSHTQLPSLLSLT